MQAGLAGRHRLRYDLCERKPMSAITVGTHAVVKKLTAAGMPEAQAEAVTSLVKEAWETDLDHLMSKTTCGALNSG